MVEEGRLLARKVVIFQSFVALIVTTLFFVFLGKTAGISAIYGSLICLIPSLVFARFAFKYAGARQNRLVVRSFSQGSKLKLALSIALFVVAYRWGNVDPVPLLVSYVTTLLASLPYYIFLSRVDNNTTQ